MTPIFYLSTAAHTCALARYLGSPGGRRLARSVVPVTYERVLDRMTRRFWTRMAKEAWWGLAPDPWSWRHVDTRWWWRELVVRLSKWVRAGGTPAAGVYIFADLELLSREEARRAAALWTELADTGRAMRLVNHPTRSMRRYELLRTLYERGINRFNVYRVTEARAPTRYPVFLRFENDHGGARTPLLGGRSELEAALAAMERDGASRDEILITEFCETADEGGVYRKYGAFVVGEHVFPKSLQFSRRWVQKRPDLAESWMLDEEREYVEKNPHEEILREVFALARIGYGRADYGIADGALQIWEINTNPHITTTPERRPRRPRVYDLVEQRMTAALEELARGRPMAEAR